MRVSFGIWITMGRILRIGALLLALGVLPTTVLAQIPEVISFQGRLADTNGVLLTGTYNVTIRLYNFQTGGSAIWTEAHTSVPVVNGIHNIYLGTVTSLAGLAFDTEYWASVEISSGGEMSPRRRVTTSPYAFRAKYADTASYADSARIVLNPAPDTDWITLAPSSIYRLGGNVGIGTANPGESLTVAGTIKGGVSNTLSGILGFIGGGKNNIVSGENAVSVGGDSNYATGESSVVSGGGRNLASGGGAAISGGYGNEASGVASTVGGGMTNKAVGHGATISGGGFNQASGSYGAFPTVGGGFFNQASGGGGVTIGGGNYNQASGVGATIGGGISNQASGGVATIGGGNYNQATAVGASISGGSYNQANGINSFAAGNQADAQNNFTFVWSDGDSFVSTADSQFLISARGGVGIETNAPVSQLAVAGTITATGVIVNGVRITDVGMISDSQFLFQANGGRVAIGQRVGIGTDNPLSPLDVRGAATIDSPTFYVDAVNDRVGIDSNAPVSQLAVAGTVTATAFVGDRSRLTGISIDTLSSTTSDTVHISDNIDLSGKIIRADSVISNFVGSYLHRVKKDRPQVNGVTLTAGQVYSTVTLTGAELEDIMIIYPHAAVGSGGNGAANFNLVISDGTNSDTRYFGMNGSGAADAPVYFRRVQDSPERWYITSTANTFNGSAATISIQIVGASGGTAPAYIYGLTVEY